MAEFQISTAALMQNEEHFTQLQGALLEGFEVWARAALAGVASSIADDGSGGADTSALQQQYWNDVVQPAGQAMLATIVQLGEWPVRLQAVADDYAAADLGSAEAIAAVEQNAKDELR